MAFKNNDTSSGGVYLTADKMFEDADNTKSEGYDNTTLPNNESIILVTGSSTNDRVGVSVAIGSNRIVVGANLDDDNGYNSGAAYISDLDGNELTKITASDGGTNDYFGSSVAVGSGRVVVGAYRDNSYTGSAYIFDLDGNQLKKITAADGASSDQFGKSVAVGSNRIVVGALGDNTPGTSSGSAYIFDLSGTQLTKLIASDSNGADQFGYSVAVGSGRVVVGAIGDDDKGSSSGSAYIFDLDGNQLAKITASDGATNDNFGSSVAVGSGRIVVGAPFNDDNGSNSGSAYIFDLDGTQLTKITASDGASSDQFGKSVAVGSGRIVVGANLDDDNGSNSGSAYIFDLDGNELTKITASDGATNDNFGSSVAVGSGRICVGAFLADDNGTDSGSIYIYNTPDTKHILDILDR